MSAFTVLYMLGQHNAAMNGLREAQSVRPTVRSAQRTTTLMMSLFALVKRAFNSDNEVNKKAENNLQCPKMNCELIAQIRIII